MDVLVELTRASGEVYFRLHHDEAHHMFRAEWMGTLTQAELQLAAHKGLECLLRNEVILFLLDMRACQSNWQDICSWVRVMWTPKSLATPLRFFAHLLLPEVLHGRSLEVQNMVHGSVCHTFENETEAVQWLDGIDVKALVQA